MKCHFCFKRYLCVVWLSLAVFAISGCSTDGGLFNFNSSSNKEYSTDIMGCGKATESMMVAFLRNRNTSIPMRKISYVAKTYILESGCEGVNHDVAFVQMCHETNFLKFGGTVTSRQNNFCGLGTTDSNTPGASFSTIRSGIRAHIQHLKAYGSTEPLKNRCIDPRFGKVKRGCCKNIHDLTGRWAVDKNYGDSLEKKLQALFFKK